MSNIGQMIRQLAGNSGDMDTRVCVVTAVDKEARTADCEPLDESAPILGVNLQANQCVEHGVVVVPKVGSHVIVAMMHGGMGGCVIATEEVESVDIKIGESSVLINGDGVVLNGGSLRGMVKIAELEENLNQLKNYVETLKSATSAGLNAVGVSTAANGPAGATTFDGGMAGALIQFKNMENEKVKQ